MSRPLVVLAALALAAPAAAVPLDLSHQGRLFDDAGLPLDGPHELTVALHDAETGGTELFTTVLPVSFDNGFYSVSFGPLDPATLGDALFFGLAVDGIDVGGRVPVESVPFAMKAHSLEGGTVEASEISVNGTLIVDSTGAIAASIPWGSLVDVPADADTVGSLDCGLDEVPRYDGSAWGCASDADHTHDADAIVSGTLGIAFIPVGTGGDQVAAGDHTHTAAEVGALAASGGTLTGDLDLDGNVLKSARVEAVGSEPTCDGDHVGAIYFDTALSAFRGCDGKAWLTLAMSRNGDSKETAGTSCKTILDDGLADGDGVYWIDPNGGSTGDAFRVQCDMTTEGGGWTLVAYNWDVSRTFLVGQYHAVAGELVFTQGKEAALDPDAVGLTYDEIGFSLDDPQWDSASRSYLGFWVGDDERSTYDLGSNTCQLLRRTSTSQWDGELVYFSGDGANDNGCNGGGSVFTTGHTCDDKGGGVTTNNLWPKQAGDALWGYNCISSYSNGGYGAYQSGPLHNQGVHAYWVR